MSERDWALATSQSNMAQSSWEWYFVVILLISISLSLSVDKSNFKTCDQSSFCRRNRALKSGESPYQVLRESIVFTDSSIKANILNTKNNVQLEVQLYTLSKNTARLKINEVNPILPRYEVKGALVEEPHLARYEKVKEDVNGVHISFDESSSIVLTYQPFRLDFMVANEVAVSINSKGLMNFEHYRNKENTQPQSDGQEPGPPGSDEEEKKDSESDKKEEEEKKENHMEEGMWQENFKEHHDSKPRGPSSVGVDISFPGVEHVYGIPEHADTLALKNTVGSEPYRLYNLDVFEYELDSRMALYGSIPFMVAHSASKTVGVFWMNAAETWVDIATSDARKSMLNSVMSFFKAEDEVPQVETHWISESGIIDVFVMLGPKPHDVFKQYAALTGTTALPPLFGISYHQCRWNYNDEEDVKNVDQGFDEHDIPYDVLWLDIEHTDAKKYMTWDSVKFPTPEVMQNNIASKGRKMVTIVDPHIKRESGYHIHEEASRLGLYIKNKDGGQYENWCWPVTERLQEFSLTARVVLLHPSYHSCQSSWIDFTNPEYRDWWADQFALDKYKGSTNSLYIWNDMNEPSVFHGPEITMHKDAIHFDNWEHRDVHNVYGMYLHNATGQGLIRRSGGRERPFVLSRAFFAGSQRFGPIWTGDNIANWDHLKASIPMVLSISIAGISFAGADVGGFFNNPDGELLARWYQAGVFLPFFRAHAHLDTKRREPWLFDVQYKKVIRAAVRQRYALLPYWYTLFFHSHNQGLPVVRPLWVEYPDDKSTFTIEDQFLVGKDFLVKPVTSAGQTSQEVYLPGKETYWYDIVTNKIYRGGNNVQIESPLDKIPVFQRGGSIIPSKERVRRCSSLMQDDPYTLTMALDTKGEAEGDLYIDDGHSFAYKNGAFAYMKFSFKRGKLTALNAKPNLSFVTKSWIERIVILGISNSPKSILLHAGEQSKELKFTHDATNFVLTIKKPAVNAASEWSIAMYA